MAEEKKKLSDEEKRIQSEKRLVLEEKILKAQELFAKGDKSLMNKLIKENIGLAIKKMKEYRDVPAEFGSKIYVGTKGLFSALRTFEQGKAPFSSLVYTCIENEMKQIYRAMNAYKRQEIKKEVSLDEELRSLDGRTLGEEIEDKSFNLEQEAIEKSDKLDTIGRMKNLITPMEYDILTRHLMDGFTIVDISKDYDVSRVILERTKIALVKKLEIFEKLKRYTLSEHDVYEIAKQMDINPETAYEKIAISRYICLNDKMPIFLRYNFLSDESKAKTMSSLLSKFTINETGKIPLNRICEVLKEDEAIVLKARVVEKESFEQIRQKYGLGKPNEVENLDEATFKYLFFLKQANDLMSENLPIETVGKRTFKPVEEIEKMKEALKYLKTGRVTPNFSLRPKWLSYPYTDKKMVVDEKTDLKRVMLEKSVGVDLLDGEVLQKLQKIFSKTEYIAFCIRYIKKEDYSEIPESELQKMSPYLFYPSLLAAERKLLVVKKMYDAKKRGQSQDELRKIVLESSKDGLFANRISVQRFVEYGEYLFEDKPYLSTKEKGQEMNKRNISI